MSSITAELDALDAAVDAVRVADLDEVVGELRNRGITVGDPNPVGAGRQTFLADPEGNTVELYEGPTGP